MSTHGPSLLKKLETRTRQLKSARAERDAALRLIAEIVANEEPGIPMAKWDHDYRRHMARARKMIKQDSPAQRVT